MKTHRIFFTLILILVSHIVGYSQSDSVLIIAPKVLDAFYEKTPIGTRVSILEKDSSTVIADSMRVIWGTENGSNQKVISKFFQTVPLREKYVLLITCKGYPSTFIIAHTKNKSSRKISFSEPIYLHKELEQELAQATVTASRILMVSKGDTIEYNASAFKLSEGSMLDNLVRSLPGARLDENGRITVNGEFVSRLLVNGRDFFRGDPQVALSNLPAYTVNKIKVYHKSPEYIRNPEERSDVERKKDPLVMDVGLKREYAKGWISNYEAGYGSNLSDIGDTRWIGRLFAMRYTNHSSLAIYAAANNISDVSSPGSKGEWKKASPTDGFKKTYMGGVDFSINPKKAKTTFHTTLQAKRNETLVNSYSNEQHYYTANNSLRRTTTNNDYHLTELRWENRIGTSIGNVPLVVSPSFYLSRKDDRFEKEELNELITSPNQQNGNVAYNNALLPKRAESVEGMIYPDLVDTLYERSVREHSTGTRWGGRMSIEGWYYTQQHTLDYLVQLNYNKNDQNKTLNDRITNKYYERATTNQDRFSALPSCDYSFRGLVSYKYDDPYSHLKLHLKYEYQQKFQSGHQDLLYRDDVTELSSLTPSARETNSWIIDQANTYHTTRMEHLNSVQPQVSLYFGKWAINTYANIDLYQRRINDFRAFNSTSLKQEGNLYFNPSINISWMGISVSGSIKNHPADLLYLLDIRDSTDPMNISCGNGHLDATRQYNASAGYVLQRKKYSQRFNLRANYDRWNNSVSIARLFDSQTGVVTTMPMNIDGNWQIAGNALYQQFLDKASRWYVENTLNMSYGQSADYSSDSTIERAQKLTVRNTTLEELFRADFRTGNLHVGAKATAAWKRQRSQQHTFSPLSYIDSSIGLTFSSPLLWGLDFDTDIMVYLRRGYSTSSMNTTDWVWNAALSHALGKRKQWVIKAVGFDLLKQLESVRRVINAQGRTETWYSTMPSYATLSIVFRFDVRPAKSVKKK